VAAGIALLVGLWTLLRNGKLAFLGNWLIRVPIVGRALLTFDEATFVQSLALAIESGVTAANAIGLSFKSSSSDAFKAKADSAREAILHGREMHSVLRETGLFSPETIEAVQLGEDQGGSPRRSTSISGCCGCGSSSPWRPSRRSPHRSSGSPWPPSS